MPERNLNAELTAVLGVHGSIAGLYEKASVEQEYRAAEEAAILAGEIALEILLALVNGDPTPTRILTAQREKTTA